MNLLQIGQLVAGIIVAIFGSTGLVALVKARADRRKIEAEAKKSGADAVAVLSDTAIGLVAPLNHQIELLAARVHEYEGEVGRLNKRVRELEGQIDGCARRLERATELLRRNGVEWSEA